MKQHLQFVSEHGSKKYILKEHQLVILLF